MNIGCSQLEECCYWSCWLPGEGVQKLAFLLRMMRSDDLLDSSYSTMTVLQPK